MSSTYLTLEELRQEYQRRSAPMRRVDWTAIRKLLEEIESILRVGETVPITPKGDLLVTRRERGLVFSRRS